VDGGAVTCMKLRDWGQESGSVRPSPGGIRLRSGDGPRARPRRECAGAGSGELLQRGKRMWVDAGLSSRTAVIGHKEMKARYLNFRRKDLMSRRSLSSSCIGQILITMVI